MNHSQLQTEQRAWPADLKRHTKAETVHKQARVGRYLVVKVDGGGVLQPVLLVPDGLQHSRVAVPHAYRHDPRERLRRPPSPLDLCDR